MASLLDSITQFRDSQQIEELAQLGADNCNLNTIQHVNISEVPGTAIQILSIPTLWNWSNSPLGQISKEQYDFCDTVPASRYSDYFIPSSDSFTDSYSSFLQILDPATFIPKSVLINSNIANTTPTVPIATGPVPIGWTKVANQSGQLEWKRVWNVSDTPAQWLSKINSQDISTEQELSFDTGSISIKNADGKNIPIPTSEKVTMKITAKALEFVTINPGSWYNSSLIQLGKIGTGYLPGFSPAVVFGEGKLLNCRITQFLVALMPNAHINLNSSFLSDVQGISEINIAGFSFTNGEKPNSTDDITTKRVSNITMQNSGDGNIEITTKTPVKSTVDEKAYIIAVVLQLFDA